MFACLFLCERDVININIKLTIVKYVREVMCACKSLSSVYMLNCPEIYVKESGTGFEWKKLNHALHKICFFHLLSFLAIILYYIPSMFSNLLIRNYFKHAENNMSVTLA